MEAPLSRTVMRKPGTLQLARRHTMPAGPVSKRHREASS